MRDAIAHVDRYLPRSLIERHTAATTKIKAPRYILERRGSCTVYWLGRGSKLWPTASTSTDSYAT